MYQSDKHYILIKPKLKSNLYEEFSSCLNQLNKVLAIHNLNSDSIVKLTIFIKADNKAFIESIPPTPEELDKKRNADIADEIALTYSLADEIALLWKLQTGELTIDSPEIAEQRQTVADAKLKYPKV